MFVHTNEFSSQNSSSINIGCKWFKTLIITQNLRCRSSWHWRDQKRISSTVLHHIFSKLFPVISLRRWLDSPKIELKLSFAKWRAFERIIMSFFLRKFDTGFHGSVVNSLENKLGELLCLWVFKWNAQLLESIGKTLDANSYWSIFHVRIFGLSDWIVVSVNNHVQIVCYLFDDFVKPVIVKFMVVIRSKAR